MVAKTGLMLTHCGSKPRSRLKNHLKFMEISSDTATKICPAQKAVFMKTLTGPKRAKRIKIFDN